MAGQECCIATLAMSGSEAAVESYYSVNGGRSIERHPRAKKECGLEFSSALAVPGTFLSPEPPFLLVTWSKKRRALVAAITGCP